MQVIYRILRFARLSVPVVLVWLLSACSEGQQALDSSPGSAQHPAAGNALVVYKSPTCGCCEAWIHHIESAGFTAEIMHPTDLNQIKLENDISPAYQSCHTAVSEEGYLFEGHIPAQYIRQFLKNPPADAIGLAVPGMPPGSPGMERGDRFSPYQVLLRKKDGSHEVFARVDRQEEQYQ